MRTSVRTLGGAPARGRYSSNASITGAASQAGSIRPSISMPAERLKSAIEKGGAASGCAACEAEEIMPARLKDAETMICHRIV